VGAAALGVEVGVVQARTEQGERKNRYPCPLLSNPWNST
jgi:hypothetical protein